MPKIIFKILPALFFWGSFVFVVLEIPYPESLTQANYLQIIPFFASLYFALTFTLNILLKNILSSSSLSLGLTFLLILKSLDSINWVTGGLTLISVALLFSYFKRGEKHSLTKMPKIPKLMHMRKHHASS